MLNLKQIQNYINKDEKSETIELDYGDFTITVKTNPTIEEKSNFIESVIENSYINLITPSVLHSNMAFAINFVYMISPDFPFPMKKIDGEDVVDSQAAYNIITKLDILSKYDTKANNLLLCDLEKCVKNRIDFENKKILAHYSVSSANDEAIENVNTLLHKGIDLVNIAIGQLEKNGNKLFNNLNPNNISKWVNNLQKTIMGSVKPKN